MNGSGWHKSSLRNRYDPTCKQRRKMNETEEIQELAIEPEPDFTL